MLYRNAVIKGDVVDRIGKSAMTVIVALAAPLFTFISYKHTHEIGGMIMALLIAVEITVLAIVGRRVWIELKCVPMAHFTLAFLVFYFGSLSSFKSFGSLIYYTFMVMLAVVSVIKMLIINEANEKASFIDIRMCLILFLLMDMGNALAGMVSGRGGIDEVTDFGSHGAILSAIMLLYLPEKGFINIRRIIIDVCLFFGLDLGLFMIMHTIAKGMGAKPDSDVMIGLASSCMAMLAILIINGNNKGHPQIDDEFAYTTKERLLKAIGWNISEAERFNRRKLLESAFERDFIKEYSDRLYGEMDCFEDIKKIQKILADIQRTLEELDAADTWWTKSQIEKLEIIGTDLLGKLSIAYDFDTGINDCSIELLRSNFNGKGNDNVK